MNCPDHDVLLTKIMLFGKGDRINKPEGRVWKYFCPIKGCGYSPENGDSFIKEGKNG